MLKITRYSSLLTYSLLVCVAHVLWFNFVPLITLLQEKYLVDESEALLQIAVFPIFYVLLSLHAGTVIDKYGYRNVVLVSAFFMTFFSFGRYLSDSFYELLFAQSLIAICQPYIINAISKVVSDLFSADKSTLATGICSMAMFFGMALGAAITPVLIQDYDLKNTLLFMAILTLISFLLFMFFSKENPENNTEFEVSIRFTDYLALTKKSSLQPLLIFALLSLGAFNALSTWMESIYVAYGFNLEEAGLLTGLLIIGGILGSPILTALSDAYRCRRQLLIASSFFSTILCYFLCQNYSITILSILAVITGFVFLPGLPILLAEAEEVVGDKKAGIIASLILWIGNLGAFFMIFLVSWVSQLSMGWQGSIILISAALFLSSLAAVKLYRQGKVGNVMG
jgi:predicted MFS family arabinose efflux permease